MVLGAHTLCVIELNFLGKSPTKNDENRSKIVQNGAIVVFTKIYLLVFFVEMV